jgi:NAD(P)-dependent dehydrogenase (short-subunit alcohol dehydrogenase family)
MTDRKIALVTGAGKRLGKAIAHGLADAGYAMGLHYNSSADGARDLPTTFVPSAAGRRSCRRT